MTRSDLAAEFLFDLRLSPRVVASLPAAAILHSQEDAYRAQAALVSRSLAHTGGRIIGYKIAATNPVAQTLLKVSAPFFGILLSHSTHRSPASLPAGDFTVRCIEAEYGFEIGADVPTTDRPYTRESIAEYINAAMPSIEIVDHHFSDWAAVGAESLIADNAIHGAWIEGKVVADWRHLDLASEAVSVWVNGEIIRAGTGAAVLGHPLNVVAWLANRLPESGLRLCRGDKITTGLTAPVYLAQPGDRVRADFGTLGSVEVNFLSEAT